MIPGIHHVDYVDPEDRELLVTFRVHSPSSNLREYRVEWELIAATDIMTSERVTLSETEQQRAFEQLCREEQTTTQNIKIDQCLNSHLPNK